MKNRQIIVIVLVVLCILTSSCVHNSDSYISSFENFITEIEQIEDVAPKEYTQIKKTFLDHNETYFYDYQNDLTESQLNKINELRTRYYKVIAKFEIGDIKSDINWFKDQVIDLFNSVN